MTLSSESSTATTSERNSQSHRSLAGRLHTEQLGSWCGGSSTNCSPGACAGSGGGRAAEKEEDAAGEGGA